MNGVRVGIRRVEVDGRLVDVVLDGDRIVDVGVDAALGADELIDGAGGALLPGLHDHHVHLLAMAARLGGVDLDGAADPLAADEMVRAAAAAGSLRIGGYDEHRHGPLDRQRLDRLGNGAMVRVQHRTGLSWVLSTSALEAVDAASTGAAASVERDSDGRPTGWIHRDDELVASVFGLTAPPLASVGESLARSGITGVTDATYALGTRAEVLRRARLGGELSQRLVLLGCDEIDGDWAELGPRKLLVDEVRGLDLGGLAEAIEESHGAGRAVAIHAVTRAECVVAVSALERAGTIAGDRIEHGSVLPDEFDAFLASNGVAVVVQPSLVRERGDGYLDVVDADDLPYLHRAGSLARAGVIVAVGSDAPVTAIDPWSAIATAVDRRTATGAVVGATESVDASTALGWYLADPHDLGRCRRVEVGARADLCLLHEPLGVALARPSATDVRATVVAGRLVD